jgi:hypothetical protein
VLYLVSRANDKSPLLVAELVSPRVCFEHFLDPSIADYVVETEKSNDELNLLMPTLEIQTFMFCF